MKSRYIDSLGNEISRSTYESYLAQNILDNSELWGDIFLKLNAKILAVINHNKTNIDFLTKCEGAKFNVDWADRMFPTKPGKYNENYCVGLKYYKLFFEGPLSFAWKLTDDLKKTYEQDILPRANRSLRSAKYFSDVGRGRIATTTDKTLYANTHAGILSIPATPSDLKDSVVRLVPAKFEYRRDSQSPTVKLMEKHDLPFITGPSGTFLYFLAAIEALLGEELKAFPTDYKKLFMGLIANLVHHGHHSFTDVGLVINDLHKTEPNSTFVIKFDLNPKAYYDQFLAEEYRTSDAYHQFYTQCHPSKYSAMTWSIMRDGIEEMQELKESGLFLHRLRRFSDSYNHLDGELSEGHLERLIAILRDSEPLLKKLRNVQPTKETTGLAKFIQKIKDSGIDIHAPDSYLTWGQLRFALNGLTVDSYSHVHSFKLLLNFVENKKTGSLTKNYSDIVKLFNLLENIENELNATEQKDLASTALLMTLVKKILKKIAPLNGDEQNLNLKDANGYTPLMRAAQSGNEINAWYYLDSKVDITLATPAGFTALHLAVIEGNISMVKLLLKYKADVEAVSLDGFTPLELAMMYGHGQVADCLIREGNAKGLSSFNELDRNKQTPAMVAAEKGRPEVLKALAQNGIDIRTANEIGVTPAELAVQSGHIDVLKELWSHKFDFSITTETGWTLAHFAAKADQPEVIRLLAEYKVNIDAVTIERGNTAAVIAAVQGNIDILRILEECGANLNIITRRGDSLLNVATQYNKPDVVLFLMESKNFKIDFNQSDFFNRTPLENLILFQRWDYIAKILLLMTKEMFSGLKEQAILTKYTDELTNAFIKIMQNEAEENRITHVFSVVNSENPLGLILNSSTASIQKLAQELKSSPVLPSSQVVEEKKLTSSAQTISQLNAFGLSPLSFIQQTAVVEQREPLVRPDPPEGIPAAVITRKETQLSVPLESKEVKRHKPTLKT